MTPTASSQKEEEIENEEPIPPGPSTKNPKKNPVKVKRNAKTSLEVEQGNHPLELDIILENVMSCLDIGHLKRCRLVNKQFNRHANRRLKTLNATINLKDPKSSEKFAKVVKSHHSRGIGDFPFTSFTIQNKVPPSMSKGLSDYGPLIKNLMINIEPTPRYQKSIPDFDSLVDNVLIHTQSLESLTLSNVCFQPYMQYRKARRAFGPRVPTTTSLPKLKNLIIITQFPTICSLNKSESRFNPWASTPRYYKTVQNLYSVAPALRNITLNFMAPPSFDRDRFNYLHFKYMKATDAFFRTLANQGIELEELTIAAVDTIENTIENLLRAHSLTLRTLHVTLPNIVMKPVLPQHIWFGLLPIRLVRADETYQHQRSFPMMPELRSLTLIAPQDPPYPIDLISPNTPFPALQSLTISEHLFQKCFPANGLYGSVTHLSLIFDGIKIGPPGDVVPFLLFPKMSKLRIEVTNTWSANITNNIEAIFENAQLYPGNKVTDFSISSGCTGKLNEALTGLESPGSMIKLLNHLKSENANLDLVTTVRTSILKINKPCLLNFQKLRALEIIAHAEDKIEDATGFLIIKSLNPLEKLAITNSNISWECIKEIKTLHGFCSFHNPD